MEKRNSWRVVLMAVWVLLALHVAGKNILIVLEMSMFYFLLLLAVRQNLGHLSLRDDRKGITICHSALLLILSSSFDIQHYL